MSEHFLRKLEHGAALSDAERNALREVTLARRLVRARQDISLNDNVDRVYLVMGGIAGRHKTLLHGGRRIVSFALPGDLCRVHACGASAPDLRLGALRACLTR